MAMAMKRFAGMLKPTGLRFSNMVRSMVPFVVHTSMKEEVQVWAPFKSYELFHNIDKVKSGVHMIFLGPPGVGKGTWASRLANLIKVPHIAMGDLVRNEISQKTPLAKHMKKVISSGELLSDNIIFDLLSKRFVNAASRRESGFILDGFPRTLSQAKIITEVAHIDLAVNLCLHEDVLIAKCLGRRTCSHCGGNFNVANINIDGICMPAMLPSPSCASKLTTRADDVEDVVRARMRVYHSESHPLEEFYRSQGMLMDFEIRGGISETWSRLLSALHLKDKSNITTHSQKVTT